LFLLAFLARYFLVILLVIEIAILPLEIKFLLAKSKRARPISGELLDFPEILVLLNILATIVLAIVVVVTQSMMF
jgi:hypothetical protein